MRGMAKRFGEDNFSDKRITGVETVAVRLLGCFKALRYPHCQSFVKLQCFCFLPYSILGIPKCLHYSRAAKSR